jgi:hypothetical protein
LFFYVFLIFIDISFDDRLKLQLKGSVFYYKKEIIMLMYLFFLFLFNVDFVSVLHAKNEEDTCEVNYKRLEEKYKTLEKDFKKLQNRLRTKMSDIKRLTAPERPMYYKEIGEILRAIEDGKDNSYMIYIERLKREIPLGSAKPIVSLYPQEWCSDFFTEDRAVEGEEGEVFQMSLLMEVLMLQPKAFNWLLTQFKNTADKKYIFISLDQYKRLMKYINTNKILNGKSNKENFEFLENNLLRLKNTTPDVKALIQQRQDAAERIEEILGSMQSMLKNFNNEIDSSKYKELLERYASIDPIFISLDTKKRMDDLILLIMKRMKKKQK